MRTKYCLFLLVLLSVFSHPVGAQAGIGCDSFRLIVFLFGGNCDGASAAFNAAYNQTKSCYATQRGDYNCSTSPRNHFYNEQLEAAAERQRAEGMMPAGTRDTNRYCGAYRNGCMECPGPEHPMRFKSDKGYWIELQNPGQNRLQPSIIRVLKKMADKKEHALRVTSGFRSCYYQNTKKVGVRRSQHLMGKAADFNFGISGFTHGRAASFARGVLQELGQSGGTGVYCSPAAHVDTGNTRQWNWCHK
jgi:hypothetical protein